MSLFTVRAQRDEASEGRIAQAFCVSCIALSMGCAGGTNTRLDRPPLHEAAIALTNQRADAARSDYLPSDEAQCLDDAHSGGHGRALVNGVRVADGEPLAIDVPDDTLRGWVELPAHFGSGFVFWNGYELFKAATFTGPLTRAGRMPRESATVARVSFGPSVLLFHLKEGGRFAWSPSELRVVPMPEPGLLEIAGLPDGRAAMLKEPGELWLRGVGGNRFVRSSDSSVSANGLEALSGQIVVATADDRYYSVGLDGALVAISRPDTPKIRRCDSSRKMLRRGDVIQSGYLADGDVALAEFEGEFVKVDVRTEKILEHTAPVIDGSNRCQFVKVPNDLLAVCIRPFESTIVSGLARMQPRVERVFSREIAWLFVGNDGSMIKHGSCDEGDSNPLGDSGVCLRGDGSPCDDDSGKPPKEFRYCYRTTHGQWRDRRVSTAVLLEKVGKGAIRIVRWVPKKDGEAFAIVSGDISGVYDTSRDTFIPIRPDAETGVDAFRSRGDLFNDDFIHSPDGSITGYTEKGPRHISPQGEVTNLAPEIRRVFSRGPRALGTDALGHFLQSTDYGVTWKRIVGPPGREPPGVRYCSQVGCQIGDWYRLGYPLGFGELPRLTRIPRMKTVATESPFRLVCDSMGNGSHGSLFAGPSRPGSGNIERLGAKPARIEYLRSHPYGSIDRITWNGFSTSADAFLPFDYRDRNSKLVSTQDWHSTLRYRLPFDAPRLRDSPLDWEKVRTIARDSPGGILHYNLSALPVLSAASSGRTGLLLTDPSKTVAFWAQPNGTLSMRPLARSENYLTSVAEGPDHHLYVLELAADTSELREMGAESPVRIRAARTRDSIPPHHDVVALGPKAELAILRMWSFAPPTADDPALLIAEGASLRWLAPWVTLRAGPCTDEPGYRAIIMMESGLEFSVNGPGSQNGSFLALVNWNEHRVCLEAIEAEVQFKAPFGHDDHAALVAKFGTKWESYVYSFGVGSEFVEPFVCRLVTLRGAGTQSP